MYIPEIDVTSRHSVGTAGTDKWQQQEEQTEPGNAIN